MKVSLYVESVKKIYFWQILSITNFRNDLLAKNAYSNVVTVQKSVVPVLVHCLYTSFQLKTFFLSFKERFVSKKYLSPMLLLICSSRLHICNHWLWDKEVECENGYTFHLMVLCSTKLLWWNSVIWQKRISQFITILFEMDC